MRIISKFHDYYDTVQGLGFDSSIMYLRERQRFDARANLPSEIVAGMATGYSVGTATPTDRRFSQIERCPFTILFCGAVYRGIRLCPLSCYEVREPVFCYSEEKYRSELARLGYKAKRTSGRRRWSFLQNKFKTSADYFAASGPTDRALADFAITNRVISAICTERAQSWMGFGDDASALVYNPPLKAVEFYQVKPVAQAYQELEMYIGSVLTAPERPMIAITDKDRIQQHGFDRWSFRKMPAGK